MTNSAKCSAIKLKFVDDDSSKCI